MKSLDDNSTTTGPHHYFQLTRADPTASFWEKMSVMKSLVDNSTTHSGPTSFIFHFQGLTLPYLGNFSVVVSFLYKRRMESWSLIPFHWL